MKGISDISAAWSEVSNPCMNGVWRKVWPDCIPDSQEHDTALASITENVTEIAKQTGMGDAEVGDMRVTVKSFQPKKAVYNFQYVNFVK
jgi:hypothetical protein